MESKSLYGPEISRVRIPHLQQAKLAGERWAMLTCYDVSTARIFDAAGIPVLLVGDSAANTVYGYDTTLPVTLEEMIPLVRAVVRGAERALVVADMPFGSYQTSPERAMESAFRFMKETGAQAIKLEGGKAMAPTIARMVAAGIPVMAHCGFTPQSEHQLGGYRVQGRSDAAKRLVEDCDAVTDAGAFAVVLEMVPTPVAAHITGHLAIPTIGIGAGPQCDAQVLVWQDMAGMRSHGLPRFVKQYANLEQVLGDAARAYAEDVRTGQFPGPAHSFDQ